MHWTPIKLAEIKISFSAIQGSNLERLFLSDPDNHANRPSLYKAQEWDPEPFLRGVQIVLQQYIDSKLSKSTEEDLKPKIDVDFVSAEGLGITGIITVGIGGLYMIIKDYPTLKNNIKTIIEDIKYVVPYIHDIWNKEINHRIKNMLHQVREKFREIHYVLKYNYKLKRHYELKRLEKLNSNSYLNQDPDNLDSLNDSDDFGSLNSYNFTKTQSFLISSIHDIRKISSNIRINWPNMSDVQRKETIDQVVKIYDDMHNFDSYTTYYNTYKFYPPEPNHPESNHPESNHPELNYHEPEKPASEASAAP